MSKWVRVPGHDIIWYRGSRNASGRIGLHALSPKSARKILKPVRKSASYLEVSHEAATSGGRHDNGLDAKVGRDSSWCVDRNMMLRERDRICDVNLDRYYCRVKRLHARFAVLGKRRIWRCEVMSRDGDWS